VVVHKLCSHMTPIACSLNALMKHCFVEVDVLGFSNLIIIIASTFMMIIIIMVYSSISIILKDVLLK
jgi:hypothetical protein